MPPIPLNFELIQFLNEFNIPLLIILNKIDKFSIYDKDRVINLFLTAAEEFGINMVNLREFTVKNDSRIPYLEFSALKKTHIKELKKVIQKFLP